jgi:hypothetical protein
MIPARCALSSASAISMPHLSAWSTGKAPPYQSIRQRLILQVLHDEIRRAILVADVVQSADVRMIKLRNRAGFALESVAELGVCRELRRKDLDRNRAIEARVLGFVDLAHPSGADKRQDFVRTETCEEAGPPSSRMCLDYTQANQPRANHSSVSADPRVLPLSDSRSRSEIHRQF